MSRVGTGRRGRWSHPDRPSYRSVRHRLYGALLLGVVLGAAAVGLMWAYVEIRP